MKTTGLLAATLVVLALGGCSREISLEDADAALAEENDNIGSVADIAAAMERGEMIRQRPVDQAGRDSARALVDEVVAAYEELIMFRSEEHENASESQKENLAKKVEQAKSDAAREQAELEELIELGTVADIKLAIELALFSAQDAELEVAIAAHDPNRFIRFGRPSGPETAGTSQTQDPALMPDPVEPPPSEPTPEEIREAAAAAVDGLEPLYDELAVLLEAIEEAHTGAEEKRQAGQRVTMAGVAKRQELERLRGDVAAAQMFRVTGTERGVRRIRTRLEREIEAAREILRQLGGGGL